MAVSYAYSLQLFPGRFAVVAVLDETYKPNCLSDQCLFELCDSSSKLVSGLLI